MVALPHGLAVRALVYLVAAIGLLGAGYRWGSKSATDSYKADILDHYVRAEKQAREIAVQDAEFTQQGEAIRERIRTVYRDIEREVVKNVEADCAQCGLTPDGFRMFNDALTGAASRTDPGKQADQVPGPTPQSKPAIPGPGPILDPRLRQIL